MTDMIELLIEELHDHQKAQPEIPNDRFPMWYHDQYEQWQREDHALRLTLGKRLVENALKGQEA